MKRFNKILALVLAMTMMFCVVSICASAGDTVNAAYKIRFVDNDGNPITSVEAGSTANVIVSIKTDGYTNNFTIQGFFDSNKLSHIRQNGSAVQSLSAKNCGALIGRFANTGEWEDAPADLLQYEDDEIGNGYVMDWGFTGNVVMAPHADGMYSPEFDDAMKAQYKGVYLTYTANSGDSCVKVNTYNEFIDVVRFRFLANETTNLDKTVFFLTEHPSFTNIYIDPLDIPLANVQGQVNPTLVSNLTIEYPGGSAPAPTPVDVQNIETQAQWQDKNAGLMRVAFRGNVLNYVPSFAEGSTTEIDDITELGVVYSTTVANPTAGAAGCTTVKAYTLYDFTSGGYFFRAVVGSYPYNNTDTLYANAYIVIDGQTITASNAAYQTTGSDIYTLAVGHGMQAK